MSPCWVLLYRTIALLFLLIFCQTNEVLCASEQDKPYVDGLCIEIRKAPNASSMVAVYIKAAKDYTKKEQDIQTIIWRNGCNNQGLEYLGDLFSLQEGGTLIGILL